MCKKGNMVIIPLICMLHVCLSKTLTQSSCPFDAAMCCITITSC